MNSQPKSLLNENGSGTFTKIGLDEATVTIIEIHGALGVLISLHRNSQHEFREVVYFRLCQGIPSAKFIRSVILSKTDDYWIPQITGSDTYLYEPSKIEYQTRSISTDDYHHLADAVIAYESSEVVSKINELFCTCSDFEMDKDGILKSSSEYASGLPEFISLNFLEPPRKNLD